MKMTIDCPNCETENALVNGRETFHCECGKNYKVSIDYDFVDGQWRDVSKVSEILPIRTAKRPHLCGCELCNYFG